MGISEEKMRIVIDNYFKTECNIDTSIREAFEKGFRIGVKKGASAEPVRKRKWIPCIKKYPDMDETVLVYTNSHEYYVWTCMSNRGDDYFWEDEKGYYHNKYEVDLWMSLPEVLGGEEDEG